MQNALVLGFVLLAASSVAAQAEDSQQCIRDSYDGVSSVSMKTVKRHCDPKNFVTDPNEYGWVCDLRTSAIDVMRVKGIVEQSSEGMRLCSD